MKFFVTSDADEETGLHELVYEINRQPMDGFFLDRFYDDSFVGLCLVLMCRDLASNYKQRIRFRKNKNVLYIDIMCDWDVMVLSGPEARRRIVAEKIVAEVPQIIAQYKSKAKYGFKNFDLARFTWDLREWFEANSWLKPSSPETIRTSFS